MNTSQIISLLRNSGFRVLGADGDFLLLEDPSCFLRSLSDFMDIAWMVLAFVTGVMLFGWAIAMIRGAKGDWMVNLRNLMLIFGILTATKPMINLVYGDDLFVQACNIIMVPISEVQKTLAARDLTLGPIAEESGMDLRGAGAPITIEDIRVIPGAAIPAGGTASVSGREVIYIGADGRTHRRVGGTLAWRNNNPGNIICSDFTRNNGMIGCGGRFAIFPSESVGMEAVKTLLQSKSYRNLTIAGAINRWAPPFENNTAAYQRRLGQLTGLSIDTPMSALNAEQLTRVANAIKQIEGWQPGREYID